MEEEGRVKRTIRQYKGYIESKAEAALGGRGSNPKL